MRIYILHSLLILVTAVILFGFVPVVSDVGNIIVFTLICAYAYSIRDNVSDMIWFIPFSLIADIVWDTAIGIHAIFYALASIIFLTLVIKISSLYNTKYSLLTIYALTVSIAMTFLYEYTLLGQTIDVLSKSFEWTVSIICAAIIFPIALSFAQWWASIIRTSKFTKDFNRHY